MGQTRTHLKSDDNFYVSDYESHDLDDVDELGYKSKINECMSLVDTPDVRGDHVKFDRSFEFGTQLVQEKTLEHYDLVNKNSERINKGGDEPFDWTDHDSIIERILGRFNE